MTDDKVIQLRNKGDYDHLLIPEPMLTTKQVEDIARMVYARFYQTETSPDFGNIGAEDIRKQFTKAVAEVLDVLKLKNYKVMK